MHSGPGGGTFPGRIAFLSEERAMYYVIGANGSQYGPVDEATIRAWIAEGRIASPSLSFKTGESGWVPLQTREEFRDLLARLERNPAGFARLEGQARRSDAAFRDPRADRRLVDRTVLAAVGPDDVIHRSLLAKERNPARKGSPSRARMHPNRSARPRFGGPPLGRRARLLRGRARLLRSRPRLLRGRLRNSRARPRLLRGGSGLLWSRPRPTLRARFAALSRREVALQLRPGRA